MSVSVHITGVEELKRSMKNMSIRTIGNIIAETNRTALEIENYSKEARPWTDRTGNARRSIYAFTSIDSKLLTIYHGIGVSYGVYLELSHGGTYRVIGPTVNKYRTIWLNNLKGTLEG